MCVGGEVASSYLVRCPGEWELGIGGALESN